MDHMILKTKYIHTVDIDGSYDPKNQIDTVDIDGSYDPKKQIETVDIDGSYDPKNQIDSVDIDGSYDPKNQIDTVDKIIDYYTYGPSMYTLSMFVIHLGTKRTHIWEMKNNLLVSKRPTYTRNLNTIIWK